MSWFRIYVDKKLTSKGGGDHSRIFDVEAKDETKALAELKLKTNEEVNSIVSLAGDPS